jgi:hypothetical protein
VCVCVCVRVCVRACVRECVRACARACVQSIHDPIPRYKKCAISQSVHDTVVPGSPSSSMKAWWKLSSVSFDTCVAPAMPSRKSVPFPRCRSDAATGMSVGIRFRPPPPIRSTTLLAMKGMASALYAKHARAVRTRSANSLQGLARAQKAKKSAPGRASGRWKMGHGKTPATS